METELDKTRACLKLRLMSTLHLESGGVGRSGL